MNTRTGPALQDISMLHTLEKKDTVSVYGGGGLQIWGGGRGESYSPPHISAGKRGVEGDIINTCSDPQNSGKETT